MKQLLQGMESREKVDCLLAMTKIEDGPKVAAIYFHLVWGCGQSRSALMHGVKQSKLSEAMDTLNRVAEHCERYHELKAYQPENTTARDTRLSNILAEHTKGSRSTEEAIRAFNRVLAEKYTEVEVE